MRRNTIAARNLAVTAFPPLLAAWVNARSGEFDPELIAFSEFGSHQTRCLRRAAGANNLPDALAQEIVGALLDVSRTRMLRSIVAFRAVQQATETGPVRRHPFVDHRAVSRGRS
jgi:hypothetical protein